MTLIILHHSLNFPVGTWSSSHPPTNQMMAAWTHMSEEMHANKNSVKGSHPGVLPRGGLLSPPPSHALPGCLSALPLSLELLLKQKVFMAPISKPIFEEETKQGAEVGDQGSERGGSGGSRQDRLSLSSPQLKKERRVAR